MSLNEDIRQERFESDHHQAVVNILFTSRWLYNLQAHHLKAYGITPEQFNVLRILRGSHPRAMKLADITCRMIDKSSNATRLVDKLRQKRMVSQKICPANRRQLDIHITAEGLRTLKAIDKSMAPWSAVMGGISDREARALSRILDKIRSKRPGR